MADRNLLVRILGDSSSLERSFKRSAAATAAFEKQTVAASSRTQTALGKISAIRLFAGGVAATAAVTGIRSVVRAAAESQQVLGQTRVALEATGNSWQQYGQEIEAAIKAQSRFGFDDEALLRTFSLFVRGSGDVTQALRENNLAMDVARARFIDLEQAANIVNKAALGQAGSLRRLGIDTKGATTGTELLTLLTEKYGGAAKAAGDDAATAFQRAQVSIENAKEEIGGNLLPTVAGLATTLSDTLDLFTQLGRVKIPEVHVPLVWDISFGGGTLGGFAHKAIFTLPEFVNLTKDVVNNLLDNWRQATDTSEAEAAARFGEILDGFATNVINDALTQQRAIKVEPGKIKGFGTGLTPKDLFGPLVKQIPAGLEEALLDAQISGNQTRIRAALVKIRDRMLGALDDPRLQRAGRIQIKTIIESVTGQIEAIDKAFASAADQAKADRATKAAKAAETRRKAMEKLAEENRKAAEAAKAAVQARQFRALGLSATGEDIVPGFRNLLQQFASLDKRLGDQKIGSKLSTQFDLAGKLLKRSGSKLTEETRKTIVGIFQSVRDTIQKETSKELPITTKTSALNTDKILAGLGLPPDLAEELRKRLAGFNTAGRGFSVTPGTVGAFGQPITATTGGGVHINGPITVVAQNPDQFLRDLQKKAGRTSGTSRGRFPGRSLGLG